MESAPLHNARKTSCASEVHYSQEALYQMLYTLHNTYNYIPGGGGMEAGEWDLDSSGVSLKARTNHKLRVWAI